MPPSLITAHNGADGTPENSMEFVRHALASDADALEIDIRRLPDGTLVFTHDLPELSAGTFPGPASDPASDPVSGQASGSASGPASDPVSGQASGQGSGSASLVRIKTVFDALRESRTGKWINCDLKEAGLESAVADLAARCGIGDRIQFSGTVSAQYCRRSGLNRQAEILLNIEEYVPRIYERCLQHPDQAAGAARQAALEISAVCHRYGIRCVNAHYRLATDEFMDILDREGLGLSVWTVNDPAEAARFLQRGIFNVTTRNMRDILPLGRACR